MSPLNDLSWETTNMMNLINKFKKINIKHLIKVFTFVWGFVLIVFMTLANIGLTEDFDFLEWLGNSLIIFGIIVFGLFMGESMGEDKQKEKPDGLYQINLKKYEDKRLEVEPYICYFNQFYDYFSPLELYRKKREYLISKGVDPKKAEKILKYCTIEDYASLKEHAIELKNEKGESVYIRKLLEFEQEPILKVLKGEIRLDAQSPAYFLSAFTKSTNKSILEMGGVLEAQIKENKKWNRIIKIVFSLGVSFIWALFTVKDFVSGNDAQAWTNLISRITALFTSLFSGWLSSIITVKLLAQILNYKRLVLVQFLTSIENKLFELKEDDELAKEEIAQHEKEKKEALENVIIPEKVDSDYSKDEQSKILQLGQKQILIEHKE